MSLPSVTLSTGAKMPQLGLGTWLAEPGVVKTAVITAVRDLGYRHLDCASNYRQEKEVGEALAELFAAGVVRREDLFITSKVNNQNHAPEHVLADCANSLKDLGIAYLDLYLVHWPMAYSHEAALAQNDPEPKHPNKMCIVDDNIPVSATWSAMETLYDRGLVKAIGVANFAGAILHDLMAYARVKPSVNQIENHPYLPQHNLVAYCKRRGIVVTAYSPLGTPGSRNAYNNKVAPWVLENEVVVRLGTHYARSPAQICLRWQMQRGVVAIPKSVNPERLKDNINLFDFELSEEHMKEMDGVGVPVSYRYLQAYYWCGVPIFD